LGVKGIAIGTGIIITKMSKRSSDTGTYYAVEFDWQEQKTERVAELKSFVTQHNLYAARMNGQQNLELPAVTEEVDVEF
jgi:hypothetical protein